MGNYLRKIKRKHQVNIRKENLKDLKGRYEEYLYQHNWHDDGEPKSFYRWIKDLKNIPDLPASTQKRVERV